MKKQKRKLYKRVAHLCSCGQEYDYTYEPVDE